MSDRIAFTLHELVAEFDAYADDVLRERHGVTFNHFQFLTVLADVEPADMTTLARCLGITKAAVSKRVPALVAGAWITADSPPGTGRSIRLALAPKGTELVLRAGAELEAEFGALLADPELADDPIDVPLLNRRLDALTALVRRRAAARRYRPTETPA